MMGIQGCARSSTMVFGRCLAMVVLVFGLFEVSTCLFVCLFVFVCGGEGGPFYYFYFYVCVFFFPV